MSGRVQIGARVAKEYRGGSWAVGTVKPRVIRGKATEEVLSKRYHASRLRALSQLTFDASVAGDSETVDDLASVLMLSGLLFPGEMVKRLRLDRGLTQVDLAKRSMVSPQNGQQQAKLSADLHATQNGDASHGGNAVFDASEDGERMVVANAVGDSPVLIKPEAKAFGPAAHGK